MNYLYKLFVFFAIFVFPFCQASAEGFVASVPGFVYSLGGCGLNPPPVDVQGASPSEVYSKACLPSVLGDSTMGCSGEFVQVFGPLLGIEQNWTQWDNVRATALYRHSYSRIFSYNSDKNCAKYNNAHNYIGIIEITRHNKTTCPANSHFFDNVKCECDAGFKNSVESSSCLPLRENLHDKALSCQVELGDPILPLTGSNRLDIAIGDGGFYPIKLMYDSRGHQPNSGDKWLYRKTAGVPLDPIWAANFSKRLDMPAPNSPRFVQAQRGSGAWVTFRTADGANFRSDTDIDDILFKKADGTWIYKDIRRGVMEIYNASGQIVGEFAASGAVKTFLLSDASTSIEIAPIPGFVVGIKDFNERRIDFSYDVAGKLNKALFPGGLIVKVDYDASGQARAVVWEDGELRKFLYERADMPWALTGVIDENGARTTTFEYSPEGRAISTSQSGGANRYGVAYDSPPFWEVVDAPDASGAWIQRDYYWKNPTGVVITGPNGQTSRMTSKIVQGMPKLVSQDQPAGSGCSASTSNQSYDANGNVAWKEDFKGNRTCHAHDLSRNLETSRVEGLAANSNCDSVLPAGATLPANSRRISTQWHPVWRLETKVAEPRRLTTKVYNGQPDPFNGGATASCVPSNATLPDGSPIVVLCKQVEQATTDANGALGFSATVDTSVPSRVQQWTYNQYGQVLTYKDPLGNTTTNAYYADTTADHTMGDLATVTNALNQVVTYTKYNPAGQWLEMKDANGVTSTRTFDLRQRLKTTATAGLTTSYDYWPTGLLKSVTLPDTSSVNYGYDDAHRLTSVTDNLGNKITYTLDNSGNRIGENVTDPTGRLAKTLTRVPDALNRIQQVSGRE